ncbi:MAG: FAD-containing monooxygenase EthA, partial [Gammaproteobacteria bacterium]|nr:FAD-containing monooxygenase EthA [Gammaproteobacteria bacterium]
LLKHMDAKGAHEVQVALREQDRDMDLLPWIDTNEFNPGYMLRSLEKLPKRGANPEWQHTQDYWSEKEVLPNVDLDNDLFIYR